MKDIMQALKAHISPDRIVKTTCDMIRIKSFDGVPRQETGVAEYIKSVFDKNGVPCVLKPVADGRCNVIATLDSGLPGKTLLFNTHIDTVGPGDMEDPFEPRIKDGKLYGRGADDPKGAMACAIEALLAIKETGALKKGKIILTGVVDEEKCSLGTVDLIESGIKADGAIIAEATDMKISTCHKGLEWLRFRFIGKAVHSGAQSEGINAIDKAAAFVTAVNNKLAPALKEKSHPMLGEGTVNCAVIRGGIEPSNVPGECVLELDRRFLPSESYESMLGGFQSIMSGLSAKDQSFKCEMTVSEDAAMKKPYLHLPMETDLSHPLVTAMKSAVSETGRVPCLCGYPAWTDAGLLSSYAHIPCVIFAPGRIEQCHASDEHIPVNDLPDAALIYALAATEFCNF